MQRGDGEKGGVRGGQTGTGSISKRLSQGKNSGIGGRGIFPLRSVCDLAFPRFNPSPFWWRYSKERGKRRNCGKMRFPLFFTDLSLRRWNQEKSFPRCFSLFPRKKVSVAALQLRKRCAFEKSFFLSFSHRLSGGGGKVSFFPSGNSWEMSRLATHHGGDTWDTEKREKKLPHSAPFYTWCVLAASFLRFFLFYCILPSLFFIPAMPPAPVSLPRFRPKYFQPSLHASIPIPQTQKAG